MKETTRRSEAKAESNFLLLLCLPCSSTMAFSVSLLSMVKSQAKKSKDSRKKVKCFSAKGLASVVPAVLRGLPHRICVDQEGPDKVNTNNRPFLESVVSQEKNTFKGKSALRNKKIKKVVPGFEPGSQEISEHEK